MNADFLASLSWDSLQKLRRIVKQVHMRHYPTHMSTDYEADKVIEALGPEIMQREVIEAAKNPDVTIN
jgi:hypothetical protein|tara:strand:+ start:1203 stop:1406 length:204 start_codon:yes stop_codon:yes gene_type:complete